MKRGIKLKKKSEVDLGALPEERKGISKFEAYTMLLYGPEGIGKTQFGSQAPEPLFLTTEAGVKAVDVYEKQCPSWEHISAAADRMYALAAEGKFKYGAIVLDTADNAFDFCQIETCAKLGIEHPSDEDYGKGYQAVRQEFSKVINRIALINRPFILISHEKSVEVKGRIIKTNKIVPTLTNQGRKVILPMCDLIGHCGFRDGMDGEATAERVIVFEPSEVAEAKDRFGVLPKVLPLNFAEFNSYLTGERTKPRAGRAGKLPTIKRLSR